MSTKCTACSRSPNGKTWAHDPIHLRETVVLQRELTWKGHQLIQTDSKSIDWNILIHDNHDYLNHFKPFALRATCCDATRNLPFGEPPAFRTAMRSLWSEDSSDGRNHHCTQTTRPERSHNSMPLTNCLTYDYLFKWMHIEELGYGGILLLRQAVEVPFWHHSGANENQTTHSPTITKYHQSTLKLKKSHLLVQCKLWVFNRLTRT